MKQKLINSEFAILGAGSWGTALALYLARREQSIRLWSGNVAHIQQMISERCNQRYLPQYPFPPTIKLFHELDQALQNCSDILIAVPSVGFAQTVLAIKPLLKPETRIVWATKGLDHSQGQMLHDIAHTTLGSRPYAVISGPSFAREVAAGLPTALVIAGNDERFNQDLSVRFNSQLFRTYLSQDMIGVEIGGVMKNILAIATGISDGLKLGANARSALVTRGLVEMSRLGIALGGRPETFTGLAGLGDLILTCTDDQSRNRRFGLALGLGKTIDTANKEINQVIEGENNAIIVMRLAKKLNIELPICETVLKVLQSEISIHEAVQILLSRTPKSEH